MTIAPWIIKKKKIKIIPIDWFRGKLSGFLKVKFKESRDFGENCYFRGEI